MARFYWVRDTLRAVRTLGSVGLPARYRGWQARVSGLVLSALLLACAHQAWSGMLPVSLWLDDLWVATLVKCASLPELFSLNAPAPVGFIGLLKLIRLLFGDGHGPLQALSFCARLAAIGGVAWLTYDLTRSFGLGLLAAAGLALQSELATQSVRVKQYTLDALVGVLLLGLALRCLRHPSCKRLGVLAGATMVALPCSFASTFVGPLLFTLCGLTFAYEHRRSAPKQAIQSLVLTGSCDAIVAAQLFAMVRHKATPALQEFWSANYVPLGSLSGFRAFFAEGPGWAFLTSAFRHQPLIGLLEPIGVWVLLRTRWTRPLGVFAILMYSALIASSALRLYPIGEPRVDSFLLPIVVLLCVLGLQPIARWRLFTQLLGVGACAFALWRVEHEPVSYIPAGEKPLAELVDAWAVDGDVGLLVFPWANWALAYYGRWPVDLVPVSDSTNGFFAIPRRPNTVVLRETWNGVYFSDYARQPSEFDAQLQPLMAAKLKSLVFYGSYGDPGDYAAMLRQLKRRHYRVTRKHGREMALAVMLERP